MLLQYIILGLIQGLTETIPVSSSGHLMIIKRLMESNIESIRGIREIKTLGIKKNLISDLKDIIKLIKNFFKYISTKDKALKSDFNYCWMIVLGCIPAGLMGLVISKLDIFEKIENNIKVVGISLIITAILLFIVRNFKGTKDDSKLGVKEALTVGCFQILGLLPGISRSGSTIVGGMTAGLKRDTAFKYSFMLYIPLSLAAMVLELTDIEISKNLLLFYGLATILAGVATYLVTKWFRQIVIKGKLIYFSIYCLIVGILVLIFL